MFKIIMSVTMFLSTNAFGSELIVKFKAGASPSKKFTNAKVLIPNLNIFLVETKDSWQKINRDPSVIYAQPNHLVKRRNKTPNDADFASQWSMRNSSKSGADVGATLAWSLGVGGKDSLGNDIVVAVVDGGVDVNHPDLKENIWLNKNEIPENGVDDDGNGFVDDMHGWDI